MASQPAQKSAYGKMLEELLGPKQSYESVTRTIGDIVLTPLKRTPWGWALGFVLAALGLLMYLYSLAVLFTVGVGIWGLIFRLPGASILSTSSGGLALDTPGRLSRQSYSFSGRTGAPRSIVLLRR